MNFSLSHFKSSSYGRIFAFFGILVVAIGLSACASSGGSVREGQMPDQDAFGNAANAPRPITRSHSSPVGAHGSFVQVERNGEFATIRGVTPFPSDTQFFVVLNPEMQRAGVVGVTSVVSSGNLAVVRVLEGTPRINDFVRFATTTEVAQFSEQFASLMNESE